MEKQCNVIHIAFNGAWLQGGVDKACSLRKSGSSRQVSLEESSMAASNRPESGGEEKVGRRIGRRVPPKGCEA